MTALENVMVGRHVRTRSSVIGAVLRTAATRAEERAVHERSYALLEYVASPRAGTTSRTACRTATSAGSRSRARSPTSQAARAR